jgi:hypothetical protein
MPTDCLSPGCRFRAAFRGLCTRCYKTAKGMVESGMPGAPTWEQLEQMGLALGKNAHIAGLAASDPFAAEFRRKAQELADRDGPQRTDM